METVRWFSPDVEKIAPEWRATVVHTGDWQKVDAEEGFAHGEAQGFFVTCGSIDAYAKRSGDVFRAAHEKIAADLAFDLGLPIPPVILFDPDGERCSASVLPFLGPQKWGVAQNAPSAVSSITPRLGDASSAMTVFDTWVQNQDRHNAGNLVVSLAWEGGPGIAYIDYANSLTHSWGDNPAPAVAQIIDRFPPGVGAANASVVHETIDKIERLEEDAIRAIVDRIPDAFLSPSRKTVVSDGLLARRAGLRSVFEPQYGRQQ